VCQKTVPLSQFYLLDAQDGRSLVLSPDMPRSKTPDRPSSAPPPVTAAVTGASTLTVPARAAVDGGAKVVAKPVKARPCCRECALVTVSRLMAPPASPSADDAAAVRAVLDCTCAIVSFAVVTYL